MAPPVLRQWRPSFRARCADRRRGLRCATMNLRPPPDRRPITCEIIAPSVASAAALAEIAARCASHLGQHISVETLSIGADRTAAPLLTLHLPAALAATQDEIWCLACRLVCQCPGARIRVLIQAADAFGPSVRPESLPRTA